MTAISSSSESPSSRRDPVHPDLDVGSAVSRPGEPISGAFVSLIIVNAVRDALAQVSGAEDVVRELAYARARFRSEPRALMSRPAFLQALERARATTGDAALGLTLGAMLNEMSFHLIGPMLATCRTPRQGIDAFIEARRMWLGGADWNLHSDGDQVVVGYTHEPELGLGAQIEAEMAVATSYRVLVHAMGEDARGCVSTSFGFAPPPHSERYRASFGDRLEFRSRFTGLSVPQALLYRARPGSSPEVSDAWRAFASERLLSPVEPTSFQERARRAIKSTPVLAALDPEQLARSCNVSLRSLRRRLEEERTTLSDLINEERFERARVLLAARSQSVHEIARALGYFQVTSFQRAFKRWSGLTPGEFRREHALRRP